MTTVSTLIIPDGRALTTPARTPFPQGPRPRLDPGQGRRRVRCDRLCAIGSRSEMRVIKVGKRAPSPCGRPDACPVESACGRDGGIPCLEIGRAHQQKLALCDSLEALADALPSRLDRLTCLRIANELVPMLRDSHRYEEETVFSAFVQGSADAVAGAAVGQPPHDRAYRGRVRGPGHHRYPARRRPRRPGRQSRSARLHAARAVRGAAPSRRLRTGTPVSRQGGRCAHVQRGSRTRARRNRPIATCSG